MTEQLVRPVQTRVVTRKGHDYIEFGVRVPRQAVEASALDPEGIATAVARSWANELRNELGLPPLPSRDTTSVVGRGPSIVTPSASGPLIASTSRAAVPRAAIAGARQRPRKAIDVTQ